MKHSLPLFGALTLITVAVQAEDARQHIDIPAQALSSALDSLAKQSKLQMLFDKKITVGKQAPAVRGEYSGIEALRKLLAGSGLNVELTGDNAVSIRRAEGGSRSTNTMPAIKVTGKAINDVHDPYFKGYTVPNATAGTKTDTPIMETPLNVQVVSKQVLKDQQVISLDQALKNVSGVTSFPGDIINTAMGGVPQNITLRGFQSETFFRNGFRLQQGGGQREMANIESVEVLKGPSAILYGLVEPGGMVNVTTKQPLATPYYALQQQFGSYELYRTTLDATGPLNEEKSLLYRMNMSYENSGSYREFIDNEKVFLAPVLKWNISDRTRATLELEYNHDNLGLDVPYVPSFNGEFMKIPRSRNYGEPFSKGTSDTIFVGLNWSHDFNENWTLKHNFALNQRSNDLALLFVNCPRCAPIPGKIPRTQSFTHTRDNTYSTNLDLVGHFKTFGLEHTLLIGGDYYRIDNAQDTIHSAEFSYIDILNPVHPGTNLPIPLTTLQRDAKRRVKTDQFGLYLQDQIKLPYHVFVTGGFRYQYLHQLTDFSNKGRKPFLNPPLTADEVTPRVGVLWQPQSWLSIYGNYAESFGANDTSMPIYPGKATPPTGAQQWEVGIKTELFGGRLRATLAYYDLTKQNIVTADPQNFGFGLLTGEARSRGPELDIQGEILPGWNVIATYSNTDVRVTKGGNASQPAGSRFWNVPRNTASVWSTYDFQNETLRGLKIGGGVTLRDNQLAFNSVQYTVPGYGVVDLMASYSTKISGAKVTAQVNVNNLLNKYYYLSAAVPFNGLASSGLDGGWGNFGQPRSVMGSIRVEF